MTTTKQFHIGDVLSITTGCLLSPRRIEGVYDILNWMTQDNLYTHQLPRAAAECKPHILRQHPQLAGLEVSGVNPENFNSRIAEYVARFSEFLPIEQLPPHAHEFIDPLSELAEKVHPDRIVTVRR